MRTLPCLALAALLGLAPCAPAQTVAPRDPEQSPLPDVATPADTMDPVLRAILFAMAARALRDAAASGDPLAALADTLERSITAAATSPQNLRTVEALAAHALKDAPPELRQALSDFIVSALKHARGSRPQTR